MREMTDTAAGAPSAVAVDADPSADRLRRHLRATIEALFEAELHACLGRHRDGRRSGAAVGYRHGRRERRRAGTFGTTTVSVPRARVEAEAGAVGEWRAQALSRYQRRTRTAQAPIASLDLAGPARAGSSVLFASLSCGLTWVTRLAKGGTDGGYHDPRAGEREGPGDQAGASAPDGAGAGADARERHGGVPAGWHRSVELRRGEAALPAAGAGRAEGPAADRQVAPDETPPAVVERLGELALAHPAPAAVSLHGVFGVKAPKSQ
jgi:hypothetical protein